MSKNDPNAPSAMQMALKRVEIAIRRKGQCEYILALDRICLLKDEASRKQELMKLTRLLDETK